MKRWRKVIKRTLIVISIPTFFLGGLWAGDNCELDYPEYIVVGILGGGFWVFVVWICYFAVLWIIKGFREEKTIQKIKQE